MVEVLNASTGTNNSTQNKFAQFVLSRSFDSGFGLDLMAKDLGIAARHGPRGRRRRAVLGAVRGAVGERRQRAGARAATTPRWRASARPSPATRWRDALQHLAVDRLGRGARSSSSPSTARRPDGTASTSPTTSCPTATSRPTSTRRSPLDGDKLECWSVLAALAATVPRLRLGTLVSSITFRHPAVLANIAAAVDNISGGRLVLGIGAGWQRQRARRVRHRARHGRANVSTASRRRAR